MAEICSHAKYKEDGESGYWLCNLTGWLCRKENCPAELATELLTDGQTDYLSFQRGVVAGRLLSKQKIAELEAKLEEARSSIEK